jgi:hypothetical protein
MQKPSAQKTALLEKLDRIIQKNERAYELALRDWRENFSLKEPAQD